MAKRKSRQPDRIVHATELRAFLETAITAGETALRALDQALEADEDQVATLWRIGSHSARDFERFAQQIVVSANLPPGNRGYVPYDAPANARAMLESDLQTPRPQNEDEHANEAFCCAFHRELPRRHTAEWDAWKINAEEILAECPGQRLGYLARLENADEERDAFKKNHDIDVEVSKWGDLTVPASFDPWPTLVIGHTDDYRHRIVERTIWGHDPNESGPIDARETGVHFSRERSTHVLEYGPLRLYLVREYATPEPGEALDLYHVPPGEWYRVGKGRPKQRRNELARGEADTIVTYLGPHEPAAQLRFI